MTLPMKKKIATLHPAPAVNVGADCVDPCVGHDQRAKDAQAEVLKGNQIIEKLMVRRCLLGPAIHGAEPSACQGYYQAPAVCADVCRVCGSFPVFIILDAQHGPAVCHAVV